VQTPSNLFQVTRFRNTTSTRTIAAMRDDRQQILRIDSFRMLQGNNWLDGDVSPPSVCIIITLFVSEPKPHNIDDILLHVSVKPHRTLVKKILNVVLQNFPLFACSLMCPTSKNFCTRDRLHFAKWSYENKPQCLRFGLFSCWLYFEWKPWSCKQQYTSQSKKIMKYYDKLY